MFHGTDSILLISLLLWMNACTDTGSSNRAVVSAVPFPDGSPGVSPLCPVGSVPSSTMWMWGRLAVDPCFLFFFLRRPERGEGKGERDGVRISFTYRTAMTCFFIIWLVMIGGSALGSSCKVVECTHTYHPFQSYNYVSTTSKLFVS